MGKRFAILIGLAAAGVMALGAQTGATASEGVVSYGTKVTILKDQRILHGRVRSEGGSKCRVGREVILFKKRPGPDRKLGADRSGPGHGPAFFWEVHVKNKDIKAPLYAKVTPEVGDGFVCRADTSGMLWKTFPPSMRTTGDPVDSTPPDLQLSGPKKQDPQNDGPIGASYACDSHGCNLEVRVSCGDEACTVRAWGKLTNVKMDKLEPNGPVDVAPSTPTNPIIGPSLAKEAQRREVRKALDNGENVKAKVTVKATDAAGNVATAKRTITLVK